MTYMTTFEKKYNLRESTFKGKRVNMKNIVLLNTLQAPMFISVFIAIRSFPLERQQFKKSPTAGGSRRAKTGCLYGGGFMRKLLSLS